MTTLNTSQLITPPREEEEIYPYRRAWRSIFVETAILTITLLVSYVVFELFHFSIPSRFLLPTNIVLALLPALLWLLFSRLPEDSAVEPRRRLLTTFTVTALVANAIGFPLLDKVLQPEEWLPLQSTLNRILGYTTTVGILQEFLKYLVIRYIVWPQYYRTRTDSIAYGAASAIAYAMVMSLNYVLQNPTATPDAVMLRVYALTVMNLSGGIMIAYGLSESLFADALSFLLPFMIIAAALLNGVAIALRTTFMNASLALTISTQRTIFGIGLMMLLYAGSLATMYFLFNVSQRRAQHKQSGQV